MVLQGDERIDYLYTDQSMQIIQSPSVFSYSIDAVLLANFARLPKKRGKILDLCTGNGVVPLLMSKHTSVPIKAVEIQARLFDMAERSVALNEKQAQIELIHDDLKHMPARFGNDKFDLVTVNPPYFDTADPNHHNKNDYLTIARHEVMTNLEEVIATSSRLVKSGGKFVMVHRPNRFVDIIYLMRHYQLEPKRMQFVYPKEGKEANILLIEAIRDGKSDVHMLPPFYVFDETGDYSEAMRAIVY